MPGRLRSEQVADFNRNARPASSESALKLPGQQERHAEVRVQFGVFRPQAQGRAIALLRLGGTAEMIEYVPEILVSVGNRNCECVIPKRLSKDGNAREPAIRIHRNNRGRAHIRSVCSLTAR